MAPVAVRFLRKCDAGHNGGRGPPLSRDSRPLDFEDFAPAAIALPSKSRSGFRPETCQSFLACRSAGCPNSG